MASASKLDVVSTRQQRIAELAKQSPQMGFTSLAYHIDLDWLREAYRRTRKDGAPGVDGQTAADYEKELEHNLQSLLDRAKSGTYRAPPVRRVHIPKGTGGDTRPIGIPTLEDKVLQRAVVMVLEAVYEQDFYDSSYGFRPGRSAHQALDALWRQTMRTGGGWILEVDIRKFLDTASGCPFKNASCGAYRRAVCGIAPRFSVDREKGKDQSLCPWPLELYRCEFGRESSETERAISRPVGAP